MWYLNWVDVDIFCASCHLWSARIDSNSCQTAEMCRWMSSILTWWAQPPSHYLGPYYRTIALAPGHYVYTVSCIRTVWWWVCRTPSMSTACEWPTALILLLSVVWYWLLVVLYCLYYCFVRLYPLYGLNNAHSVCSRPYELVMTCPLATTCSSVQRGTGTNWTIQSLASGQARSSSTALPSKTSTFRIERHCGKKLDRL